MGLKRVIAIALLLLGGYYLLVAAGVIPSGVRFGNYYPDSKVLAFIAIALIVIGLLIDNIWMRKIKNVLS